MKHVFNLIKPKAIFSGKLLFVIVMSFVYIVIISWIWNFSFRKIKEGKTTETYKEWWDSVIDFMTN